MQMNKNIRTILIFLLIGVGVYVFTYLVSGLIAGPSRFSWLLKIDYEQPAEFIKALIITEIPYVVFGFLWILKLSDKKEIKNYEEEKTGMISAFIGIVVTNFLLYLIYYLDLLIGNTSSTGSLIFFVFPFFAAFFGVVGYALGHVFYWKRRQKNK